MGRLPALLSLLLLSLMLGAQPALSAADSGSRSLSGEARQDLRRLLKLADEQHEAGALDQQRSLLAAVANLDARNVELAWRQARLAHRIGSNAEPDSDAAREAFASGLVHAELGYALAPNNLKTSKWLAILISDNMDHYRDAGRIAAAHRARRMLDAAVTRAPRDPEIAFALGLWHYEVSETGPLARWFTSTFIGEPPQGNLASAYRMLNTAQQLRPASISYAYWKGRTLERMGDAEAAQIQFEKALSASPSNAAEVRLQADAKSRLIEVASAEPDSNNCVFWLIIGLIVFVWWRRFRG